MATPRKLRSQGPAEAIDLDHPQGEQDNRDWLNVEKELSFYTAFHSNTINKWIHLFCIPTIVWSSLVLFAYLPLPGSEVKVLGKYMAIQPSVGLLLIILYQIYYIALEPIGGITCMPWIVAMYLTATYTRAFPPSWIPYRTNSSGEPSAVGYALILEAISWIAQFLGHGLFEGRAPALFTNLTQALVLAPFFVHLEILFTLFDYKPDLHKKVRNLAGLRIRDMNRAKHK